MSAKFTILADNNHCITIDRRIFERILNSSKRNLERLQEEEGRTFPELDQHVLRTLRELEYAISPLGPMGKGD